MKNVLALAVVAGLASSAFATSTVTIQTSVNGLPFAGGTQDANPGDVVRVRFVASTNLSTAVGLSGFAFYAFADNWSNSSLAAWSTPGASTTVLGAGVQDLVNGNGRFAPFALAASASLPTSSLSANTLSILGTSTASGAVGATVVGQLSPTVPLVGPNTRFNTQNPVSVFQYTFTVGTGYSNNELIPLRATVPNVTSAQIKWFNNLLGSSSTNEGVPTIENGAIRVVPTPGALALLGLGGLVAGRRRR